MTRVIGESFDSFGLPLSEDRSHSRSESARDSLEKAKDEIRRALDHLRDLQKEVDASERIGSEVRSAITACIGVEKTLVDAIHRAENVIHRVRKNSSAKGAEESVQSTEQSLNEETFKIPFEHQGKDMIASYEVEGAMESDGSGGGKWTKSPKPHLIGIAEAQDPTKTMTGSELDQKVIHKLESQAVDKFSEWYVENVLK